MSGIFRFCSAIVLAALFIGPPSAADAARGHGDWPCIQREVPRISSGMVWSGGDIDPEDKSWASDPKVSGTVAVVSSRRKTVAEAIAAIDAFAAGLKEDRAPLLKALFVGVLQNINAERAQIMSGIKRYARKQLALADAIRSRSSQRAELAGKAAQSEEDKRKLAELQEQLAWDTRIYDEREQSLIYVCETPVLLEQRLFQIGKHISQLVGQD